MSWLDMYVKYARNNEAPEEYHWWVGATILGAALRNKVFLQRGYWVAYPNLWIMIVAASGERKTTALSIGKNILTKLDHVNILADSLTPERLVADIGDFQLSETIESQALIYAPELSSFLSKKSYNEGLVTLLLRLADCPKEWSYKTRKSGEVYVRNVALSFMAASTSDQLQKSIPAQAVTDGFMARFISVTNPKAEILSVPFPTVDVELEVKVTDELYNLSLINGAMVLPKKAFDWYHKWYTYHRTQIVPTASSRLAAWYQRKPEHLLRLAIITSIATNRRAEFTVSSFEEALKHLEYAEQQLGVTYSELDATDTGKDTVKILEAVRKAKNIKHTDLLRRFMRRLTAQQFRIHIQSLIESGHIVAVRQGRGVVYKWRKE